MVMVLQGSFGSLENRTSAERQRKAQSIGTRGSIFTNKSGPQNNLTCPCPCDLCPLRENLNHLITPLPKIRVASSVA